MTLKYLRTNEEGYHTVIETTGFWRWTKTEIWIGSATVWHNITDGRRGGTQREGRLSNYIWSLNNRGLLT